MDSAILAKLDISTITRNCRSMYSHIEVMRSRVVDVYAMHMIDTGQLEPIVNLATTLLISNVRMRVPDEDMAVLLHYNLVSDADHHDFYITAMTASGATLSISNPVNKQVITNVIAEGLRGWSILDKYRKDEHYALDVDRFNIEQRKLGNYLQRLVDSFFVARPAFDKATPAAKLDKIFPEFCGAFSMGDRKHRYK
jgi:hypothetical protein